MLSLPLPTRSWKSACTCALLIALLAGCEGISLAAPEGEVTLQVQGTVRDAASGAPIANAKVAVVRLAYGWTDLASVRTDAEGRYSLTHHLRHVATDEEFRDSCTIWHNDTSTSVGMHVQASSYSMWAADGMNGVPMLRCTNELQTMHFQLRR